MKPHRFLIYALVPLLAIGGYIAAGLLVDSENTDAPRAYRLVATNGCDLRSECVLQHEALVIRLRGEEQDREEGVRLELKASEPLKGAAIAFGSREGGDLPENMSPQDDARLWMITLKDHESAGILRLLLSTGETTYFAELPVTL